MRRPTASGLGFAVARGAPIALDRVLHLDPPRPHQPGRRRLLAVVEPLDPTDRGHEVAVAALTALRDGFWSAAGQPLTLALGEAFAAANAAVRAENRLASGEGRDRRAAVGATAIALEGRQLVLAQVPPSQAVLVQEGRIYAFPDLTSWRGDFGGAGDRIAPDPEPLGCGDRSNPDLFRTLAAPDDLIVLCASAIPSCVARDGDAADKGLPAFADLLRAGDPDAIADGLGDIVGAYRLEHAHVACCNVGRLHCLDVALARETIARLALSLGVAPRPSRPSAPAAPIPYRRRSTRNRGATFAPGAGRRRRSLARLGVALDADEPDPGSDPEPVPEPDLDLTRDLASDPRRQSGEGRPVLLAYGRTGAIVRPRPLGGETGSLRGRRPLAVDDGPIGILDDPGPGDVAAQGPATKSPLGGPFPTGPVPRSFGDGMYVVAHQHRAQALDTMQLRVAMLGERIAPRPMAQEQRAGRVIAAVSPGVLGLERHRGRGAIELPGGWRLALPGWSGTGAWRAAVAACLTLLLIAGGAGAFGAGPMVTVADRAGMTAIAARVDFPAWTGLGSAARSPGADALAAVDDHLAAATAATDPAEVAAELALADAALTDAIAKGAAGDGLAAREAALAAARDRAAGIVRLSASARLGALPSATTGPSTLLLDGHEIYAAGDALYQWDEDEAALVRRVGAGDHLGDAAIGVLRGATREDDRVVLTDGTRLFWRDAGGAWSSRPLPAPAGEIAAWPTAPCGAFAGNFYLLDVDAGRILQFHGDDATSAPRDWTAGTNAEDLRGARDMVIDGRIHVLTADGRVLTFFRGALERTYLLPPEFPVADPVALDAAPDGRWFYLLDRGGEMGTGRLYRIDRETGAVHELVLAPDLVDAPGVLTGAVDVAVDEERGAVYLLSGDGLWRAELPKLRPTDA